jgi:hypothetical protein
MVSNCNALVGNSNEMVGSCDALLGNSDEKVGSFDALEGNSDEKMGSCDALVGNNDEQVGSCDAMVGNTDEMVGSCDEMVGIIVAVPHHFDESAHQTGKESALMIEWLVEGNKLFVKLFKPGISFAVGEVRGMKALLFIRLFNIHFQSHGHGRCVGSGCLNVKTQAGIGNSL